MGVKFRKIKKKGRKMTQFLLKLFGYYKINQSNKLVWLHIKGDANRGVIGWSARDRSIPVKGLQNE
tara:strand:- start:97 stop:294 length:198 start_codon:yes stop_codon:yes gene_type:complete